MDKVSARMTSQIKDLSHYKVRNRIALNANIIVFAHFDNIGLPCYIETMSQSLCPKEDSIIDVLVEAIIRLSSRQIKVEFLTFFSCSQDGLIYNWRKLLDRGTCVLLTCKVESSDEILSAFSLEILAC